MTNSDAIQPSNDLRATALAVAARLCQYADHTDEGGLPSDRNQFAAERCKVIAACAKELYEAMKDEQPTP